MKIGLFQFPVRFTSLVPIDLACLTAYLKSKGHTVYARDLNIEKPAPQDSDNGFWRIEQNQEDFYTSCGGLIDQWVQDICAFVPDIVGISVWETQVYFSLKIAKRIKDIRPGTAIVLGGASVVSMLDDLLLHDQSIIACTAKAKKRLKRSLRT